MVDAGFKSSGYKVVLVRIINPAALTIVLVVTATFLFILPMLETSLMDGKREGIMRLTENAWSVLALYHKQEQQGQLTREQAQAQAALVLSHLRYGEAHSEYFWINDFGPVMIMHPYRRDLVGKNIGLFKDQLGKKLFVAVVDTVKQSGSGFVDYLWQWKDDPLPRVTCDSNRLLRVVTNLLMNAGQALESDQQNIFVSTFKDKGGVGIEVRYTGPGVSSEVLDKLADPFFTTRKDEGGTDLGLSISQKIINEHKGSLAFTSEPGKGLTARIFLPSQDIYS